MAAYSELLELARVSEDAASYHREVQRRGLAMSTTRAEWLDRYRAFASVQAALGDEAQRQAAAARFHAGHEARFLPAILAVEEPTAAAITAARAAQQALSTLLMTLLEWRVADRDETRALRREELLAQWRLLRANDPGCDWQRVSLHPPYRARIPFDDAGLAALGDWLREAIGDADTGGAEVSGGVDQSSESGAATPESDPADGAHAAADAHDHAPNHDHDHDHGCAGDGDAPAQPKVAALVQSYRMVYELSDWTDKERSRRAYERIFALEHELSPDAEGTELLARMAEDGVHLDLVSAPHIDWAERHRAHAAQRSQPVMQHHAQALAEAAAHAPTATVVEIERLRLDACYETESAWDQLLVHAALRPLYAVLGDFPESERAVAASAAAVQALFGAPWHEVLEAPRLRDFFRRELAPALDARPPGPGAQLGDVGSLLVRRAAQQPLSENQDDADACWSAVLERIRGALARAAAAEQSDMSEDEPETQAETAPTETERPRLRLWGQAVALGDIAERLAAPPRPRVDFADPAALGQPSSALPLAKGP
ncbi:hypothetical protein Hoch_6241 [Haliangium ochraceum DSM 14365]|uniref:Uncharacterized protein n=2 Tax=Haliangium ochraceum TaxID=80816 RepID=D0LMM6_HALO1|nr:hypothetical protein Hoch_6241 [Haliangium ochraceum DSM 14365]